MRIGPVTDNCYSIIRQNILFKREITINFGLHHDIQKLLFVFIQPSL